MFIQDIVLLHSCMVLNVAWRRFPSLIRETEKHLSPADQHDYAIGLYNPSVTWVDIAWLRTITRLPLILKGVLSGKLAYSSFSSLCDVIFQ